MSTHIIQIGKHRFVCGLFWQSLSRPRELLKEARDLAAKLELDLMVLRKDNATAQAGFGNTREGLRRNMFSLAAVVSKTMALEGAYFDGRKQVAHNWLGAFKLPDGTWAYFAVRDASFLPTGDFAGSKEEVLERLYGDYGLGGWNLVVGDAELESYGFHNFNQKTIEDLIPHKKNGNIRVHQWWGLKPVSAHISQMKLVLSILGSISLLVVAYLLIQHYQQARIERMRTIAADQGVAGSSVQGKPLPLPHPWKFAPASDELLKKCRHEFGKLNPGGWVLEEYNCSQDGVQFSWLRQDSVIAFLLAQEPSASIDSSGNKASLRKAFSLNAGGDDSLLEYRKIVEPLLSDLQLIRVATRISRVLPVIPEGKAPPPEQARPEWDTYSFQLSMDSMPAFELEEILQRRGVRVSKLTYRTGNWSIEGNIYVALQ
ncbi:type 4b pilus protein PilO2 [Undibacterium sp. TS12]|uniref:type 4b pilus protein PilO2 n=1 Tax=Undibacterium sp. TS12 TaxID=2908202 RepID=UPI001F4CE490|nr:type 4b pilus protein PilO2 [Undibacterium sp. TS12]MCH8621967.1 type 4b pilus protein PilO2 [Undibacterium sp. TS12]